MRKKITAGAMLLMMMLAAGCGKDDDASSVQKVERTTAVVTDSTTEATTAATEVTTAATEATTEATTAATEVTTEATTAATDATTEATTETTEKTTEATTESTTEATTEKTTKATTEDTTESTTEKTTKTTTEATTEVTTENPLEVPTELKSYDLSTEDKMRAYLDGTWTMVVKGNPVSTKPGSSLHFEKDSSFIDLNGVNDIYFYLYSDFDSLFNDGIDYTNYMTLQVDYCSGTEQNVVDSKANIQLMTAITNGQKVLAIRESGNGQSYVATYGLDYDKTALDYMWVFGKNDEKLIHITDEMNDSLLKKGQSFYAFQWFDSGSHVTLQPVDVTKSVENWYGENMTIMTYVRSSDPMSIYAPKYELKGKEELANSGSYQPCLCYVTTDGNGRITEIKQFKYLGYGVYDADSAY